MDEEYRAYRADQAHEWLERIRRAGESCAALREQVEDARYRAAGVRGIDYSSARVSSSGGGDAMADAYASIQGAVASYAAALAAYEGERAEASAALGRMDDPTCARVLRLRYMLDRRWEEICVEMNYTYDGMMKLRRRALAEFWDVMPRSRRDALPPAL